MVFIWGKILKWNKWDTNWKEAGQIICIGDVILFVRYTVDTTIKILELISTFKLQDMDKHFQHTRTETFRYTDDKHTEEEIKKKSFIHESSKEVSCNKPNWENEKVLP